MSRDGKRRRGLTYEDRVLWSHVTRQIKPLRTEAPGPIDDSGEHAPVIGAAPAKHPPAALRPVAQSKPAAARQSPTPPPSLEPLTRRMKQRVARGKHQIDARLDLHGFTQAEAHAALLRFLRSAREREARLVLVITGKGRGGEPGVLRRQVPHWLALPEFAALVIGFEDAAITHGGEGALYVRVRRTRGG